MWLIRTDEQFQLNTSLDQWVTVIGCYKRTYNTDLILRYSQVPWRVSYFKMLVNTGCPSRKGPPGTPPPGKDVGKKGHFRGALILSESYRMQASSRLCHEGPTRYKAVSPNPSLAEMSPAALTLFPRIFPFLPYLMSFKIPNKPRVRVPKSQVSILFHLFS